MRKKELKHHLLNFNLRLSTKPKMNLLQVFKNLKTMMQLC